MLQKTATGMPAGMLRTNGLLHHQLAFGNDSLAIEHGPSVDLLIKNGGFP